VGQVNVCGTREWPLLYCLEATARDNILARVDPDPTVPLESHDGDEQFTTRSLL